MHFTGSLMSVDDRRQSLSYALQLSSARKAIQLALENSCRPVVSTKFTEDSAVLLHLLSQLSPGIPVIWIDTGYNTRATLAHAREVTARLDLNVHTYRPQNHQITVPPELDSSEHSEFVKQVKLDPFNRALEHLKPDLWFSSLRRYQSEHRKHLPVFDIKADGMLKVLPLLDWTPDCVERYGRENGLPVGPSCYDPTKGEPMRECGLHLNPETSVNPAHP